MDKDKKARSRKEQGNLLSISRDWILNEIVWYGSAAICARPMTTQSVSCTPPGRSAATQQDTATHQKVLPIPVGDFNLLFERRHEPVSRLDAVLDLGVVDLEQQAELARDRVADLGDLVPGQPDLDELLGLDARLRSGLLLRELLRVTGRVVRVAGRSPREVGLVLLALGVGEVGPFVRVQRQAQPAFETAEVVAEDVRVLRGNVSQCS